MTILGGPRNVGGEKERLDEFAGNYPARVLRWMVDLVKSVVFSVFAEDVGPSYVGLPETARYALNYQGGMFGKAEILSINFDAFKGLSVYLALKFLAQKPDLQKKLLEKILVAMGSNGSYASVNNVIAVELANIGENLLPINGTKIAQVCRQGVDLFEDVFTEIAEIFKSASQTPCLVANAALIGLGPFVRAMDDGDDLIILYLDGLNSLDIRGYYIVRFGENFQVEDLNLEHFECGKVIGIVDDTRKSGETFDRVVDFITNFTRSSVGKVSSVVGSSSH